MVRWKGGLARSLAQKRAHFCENKTTPPRKLGVNAVLQANIFLRSRFSNALFFRTRLRRPACCFVTRLSCGRCHLFSSGVQCCETPAFSLMFGLESLDKVSRVFDEQVALLIREVPTFGWTVLWTRRCDRQRIECALETLGTQDRHGLAFTNDVYAPEHRVIAARCLAANPFIAGHFNDCQEFWRMHWCCGPPFEFTGRRRRSAGRNS